MPLRSTVSPLIRCAIALLCLALPGHAQPDDEVTKTARAFFEQGVVALYAHRPEAARMAFERAYQLRPTPKIGYNLGLAELQTGRYVDAARHLGLYIHQTPKPTPEERKALEDAERHVAQLVFDVNVEGARIYIDDENEGRTPFLFQPIYIMAGRHTIRATCEGFQDVAQIRDVEAGRKTEVKLVLEPNPAKPSVASESLMADAGLSAFDAGAAAKAPNTNLDGGWLFNALDTGQARGVTPRTIVLGAGITLTVAAGVLATVEALRASSATDDVNRLHETANLRSQQRCAGVPTDDCRQLADAVDRHNHAIQLMRGALIGTAVLGSATAAIWLLWPRTSGKISILPHVQPSAVGFAVSGEIP